MQLFANYLLIPFPDQQRGVHGGLKRGVFQDHGQGLQSVVEFIPKGIGNIEKHAHAFFHDGDLGGVQSDGAAMGIGPDQSARAQQHAAEIAGDHHAAVDHAAVFEYLHHGQSRRAARFSIVAVPHDTRVGADHIGVAVVGGVPVLFPDAFEECQRFFFGFTGAGIADETALIDDEFIFGSLLYGFIARHFFMMSNT